MRRRWKVVGGKSGGGLLVRQGPELTAKAFPDRLATGAVVEEEKILGVNSCDRLYYQKLLGAGPEAGWISVEVNGTKLLELLPRSLPLHHLRPPENSDDATMEAAWIEETRYREIASVRLLLDATYQEVVAAMASSLMCPCRISGASALDAGQLRWRDEGEEQKGIPLPVVMSEQWRDLAFSSTDFSEEVVWQGSVANSSGSFSLGLRPLFEDEHAQWDVTKKQCEVIVKGSPVAPGASFCFTSQPFVRSVIHVTEETPNLEANDVKVTRTWKLQVFCDRLKEAVDLSFPNATERSHVDALGQYLDLDSIRCSCGLRATSDGRVEVFRQLFGGAFCTEAAPGPRPSGRPDFDHDPIALLASQILYMLDLETRAWASAQGFPLVELWRGVRRPFQWAVFSALSTAASHIFALGSAADSAKEREEGPTIHVDLIDELTQILPFCRNEVGKKQGQFTEGSVDIQSFAELLQRVTRRAEKSADIFRGFVDLGSGRGHAVLVAHALFPFRQCVGYEIDQEAMEAAQTAMRQYMQSGLVLSAKSTAHPLKLLEGSDFLHPANWSNWCTASVVFVNGVTWPNRMFAEIGELALKLRKGSLLLLIARRLPYDDLQVLRHFDVRGDACLLSFTDKKAVQVWIYQRR